MEEFKSRLQEYVERVKKFIDKGGQSIENVKIKLVIPLIEMFGWHPFEDEVDFGYNEKKEVNLDAVLMVNDAPEIGIKIKKLDDVIEGEEIENIIKSANKTGIKWLVFTNGKELKVYHSKWEKAGKSWCFWSTNFLYLFEEDIRLLWLLVKENVKNGLLDKYGGKAIDPTKYFTEDELKLAIKVIMERDFMLQKEMKEEVKVIKEEVKVAGGEKAEDLFWDEKSLKEFINKQKENEVLIPLLNVMIDADEPIHLNKIKIRVSDLLGEEVAWDALLDTLSILGRKLKEMSKEPLILIKEGEHGVWKINEKYKKLIAKCIK